MSKKSGKSLLLLVLVVPVIIFIFMSFWWNWVTSAPVGDGSAQRFIVGRGRGATQIANDLHEAGLIKNPLAFKFYVQLTGRASSIGAGEFEIKNNLSMFEVLKTLSGLPLELLVTIPEGLRKEEMVEKFITGLEITNAQEGIFRAQFLAEAEEGYMFPETYLFPRNTSGDVVAKRMRALFEEKISDLQVGIEKSDLSLDEIVTLASIVERETKTNTERPVVAGILLNRLNIGMALQADATAQYAVANVRCRNKTACNWWVSPTLDDLEVDSPYNTYKFTGLPPAPISSPGYSSISAVVDPTDSSYFYYIHEPNGTIHYAETLQEHNANVAKYLR